MATYVLHCGTNMTQILLVALLVALLTLHGISGEYVVYRYESPCRRCESESETCPTESQFLCGCYLVHMRRRRYDLPKLSS